MPWSRDPNRRRGVPAAQRQRIMQRHQGRCHLCGHDDADHIDHIINVARWVHEHREGSPHRDSNLAPAHQQPCPTCGKQCHRDKTRTETAAGQARHATKRPPEPHPGAIRT